MRQSGHAHLDKLNKEPPLRLFLPVAQVAVRVDFVFCAIQFDVFDVGRGNPRQVLGSEGDLGRRSPHVQRSFNRLPSCDQTSITPWGWFDLQLVREIARDYRWHGKYIWME